MVDWEFKRDRHNPDLLDMKSAKAILAAEQFECSVKWPLNWKFKAHILLIAIEKIFAAYDEACKHEFEELIGQHESEDDFIDTNLLPVCLLLEGLAVENLLKGIIYSRDPDLVIESKKNLELADNFIHHKLCDLYVSAELARNIKGIDPETKEILRVLEQFVVWRGRYPVPLNLQELKNAKPIPENLKNPNKVIKLCAKLFKILNDIPNPPTHLSNRKQCKEEVS